MGNRFLLTPLFLDTPSPELEFLAQPEWRINAPELPDGDTQCRLTALHRPIAAFVASTLARREHVRALFNHPRLAAPLYVHFDTDIINPDDAPAMSYRAQGGPSAADVRAVLSALARSGRIVAVSMTTWTPKLDMDGGSQTVCLELLDALIGE